MLQRIRKPSASSHITPAHSEALCLFACMSGYFKAIARIARQEKAKMYIPVSAPTTAIYDSLAQDVLPKDCVCWTLPPHLTGLLDDKTAFSHLCDKVGIQGQLLSRSCSAGNHSCFAVCIMVVILYCCCASLVGLQNLICTGPTSKVVCFVFVLGVCAWCLTI